MVNPTRNNGCIQFSWEDLELFSAASHDRNPLHVSASYARKTPYGEPVVFGVLAGLAAISCLKERQSHSLSKIDLEFRNPVYVGVRYSIDVRDNSDHQAAVRLYDSDRLTLKVGFEFRQDSKRPPTFETSGKAAQSEPSDHQSLFEKGFSVHGVYWPSTHHLHSLVRRFGLTDKGVLPSQLSALLWASYLVGMELPGKRATFWRLSVAFGPNDDTPRSPFSYDATVEGFDQRLNLLNIAAKLHWVGRIFANVELLAFVRHHSPTSDFAAIGAIIPESERLKGKVGLVIGGSRGVGAAICQALASQGCTVLLNYQMSQVEAESVAESVQRAPGAIRLFQGDATDPDWCAQARTQIQQEYGGLDILICSACPPIRSLSFSLETVGRFQEFLSKSLALVSLPMAAFLNTISLKQGWIVVLSSSAVQTHPAEWPHYVTAKFAIEGMVQWAAHQYRHTNFLLVRPPKLLTDQTNTPVGRTGALSVEETASRLVARLCGPPSAEPVETLEHFEVT